MARAPCPFPIIQSSVALARARREDLAASSSVTVVASASAKTIVLVLVRPTRVLDRRKGNSPIPPQLDSKEEGLGGLGFRSGNFGW